MPEALPSATGAAGAGGDGSSAGGTRLLNCASFWGKGGWVRLVERRPERDRKRGARVLGRSHGGQSAEVPPPPPRSGVGAVGGGGLGDAAGEGCGDSDGDSDDSDTDAYLVVADESAATPAARARAALLELVPVAIEVWFASCATSSVCMWCARGGRVSCVSARVSSVEECRTHGARRSQTVALPPNQPNRKREHTTSGRTLHVVTRRLPLVAAPLVARALCGLPRASGRAAVLPHSRARATRGRRRPQGPARGRTRRLVRRRRRRLARRLGARRSARWRQQRITTTQRRPRRIRRGAYLIQVVMLSSFSHSPV